MKNGVEYAKERNTETDYMYAGTDRDAVYQAAIASKQRDTRSALTTVFNSLTNSASATNRTSNNNSQTQSSSRNTTNDSTRANRTTNRNTR